MIKKIMDFMWKYIKIMAIKLVILFKLDKKKETKYGDKYGEGKY